MQGRLQGDTGRVPSDAASTQTGPTGVTVPLASKRPEREGSVGPQQDWGVSRFMGRPSPLLVSPFSVTTGVGGRAVLVSGCSIAVGWLDHHILYRVAPLYFLPPPGPTHSYYGSIVCSPCAALYSPRTVL